MRRWGDEVKRFFLVFVVLFFGVSCGGNGATPAPDEETVARAETTREDVNTAVPTAASTPVPSLTPPPVPEVTAAPQPTPTATVVFSDGGQGAQETNNLGTGSPAQGLLLGLLPVGLLVLVVILYGLRSTWFGRRE